MYKLRIPGLPEYDNQLSTRNYSELPALKEALLQRVTPTDKQARVLDLSSVAVEIPEGESWILTNNVNGVRHSYVDTSRSWQQYIEDYGDDPADYSASWYSDWKDSPAAKDVEEAQARRSEAGALSAKCGVQISLHEEQDEEAEATIEQWFKLRGELRKYQALTDSEILANDVPQLS